MAKLFLAIVERPTLAPPLGRALQSLVADLLFLRLQQGEITKNEMKTQTSCHSFDFGSIASQRLRSSPQQTLGAGKIR
jgi:hypothetical protein